MEEVEVPRVAMATTGMGVARTRARARAMGPEGMDQAVQVVGSSNNKEEVTIWVGFSGEEGLPQ